VSKPSSTTSPVARLFQRIDRAYLGLLRSDEWQQWVLVGIAIICGLFIRRYLVPEVNPNYTDFLRPWVEHMRRDGGKSLGEDFANYNVPYLYVLYLGSVTPFSALHVVKAIAIIFDLFMAIGVAAIVFHFRRNAMLAAVAAAVTLFLPEVFLNSAMWGEADSSYTAFLVWAAYFIVARKDIPAWVMFSLALAFKLQAVFFLPWILLALIVQRHRIRAALIGIVVFFAVWVPALVAGRSLHSLAEIYVTQYKYSSSLTLQAANIYQWVPNTMSRYIHPAGIFFGIGIVALLGLVYLRRLRGLAQTEIWLLQVAAAFGVLVPFILPAMHDRYFYPGDVFAVICALVIRDYLVPAIALQFTAIIMLSVALFRVPAPIPLPWLAIGQFVIVGVIVALSVVRIRQRIQPFFPPSVAVVDEMAGGSATSGPAGGGVPTSTQEHRTIRPRHLSAGSEE
jgi:Gpi18-like mannosyltransferase